MDLLLGAWLQVLKELDYRTSLFISCDCWSHLFSLTSSLNVLSFLASAPATPVSCCSSNTPGLLLAQGLCTGCFFCLEHTDPGYPRASLPYLFQIFTQMPPSWNLRTCCLILFLCPRHPVSPSFIYFSP